MIRPVFAVIAGSWPSALRRAQMSAVRRSCQTMARWMAWPVARSHTTVVSRWLVMPIAAMSLAVGVRPSSAPRGRRRWSRSRCPRARARPSRRPENAAEIPAARWRRSRCRAEHDGARGGGALIDGQHKGHDADSWRCFPGGCWGKASGLGADVNMTTSARLLLAAQRREGRGRGSTAHVAGSECADAPQPDSRSSLARLAPHRHARGRREKIYTAAVVTPPSTTMVWPVMKLDASEPR